MKRIILGFGSLGFAFGLAGWTAPELRAQLTDPNAGGDLPAVQSAERDSSLNGNILSNPARLIQELQSIPSRSTDQFARDQNGQLDDAGAEFRRLQLERLGCNAAEEAGPSPVANPACDPQ